MSDHSFLIWGDSKSASTVECLREHLNEEKVDLLLIDGEHTFEAVVSDFENYRHFVRKGGWIVFDDYTSRIDVRNAIDDLGKRYDFDFEVVSVSPKSHGLGFFNYES